MRLYLDSSAIVKLHVREAESVPLRRFVADADERCASRVAWVETLLVLAPHGEDLAEQAVADLDRMHLVELSEDVAELAVRLPGRLRALDAIHVASAQACGADVLVTYDKRMREAAAQIGLSVESPGTALREDPWR